MPILYYDKPKLEFYVVQRLKNPKERISYKRRGVGGIKVRLQRIDFKKLRLNMNFSCFSVLFLKYFDRCFNFLNNTFYLDRPKSWKLVQKVLPRVLEYGRSEGILQPRDAKVSELTYSIMEVNIAFLHLKIKISSLKGAFLCSSYSYGLVGIKK